MRTWLLDLLACPQCGGGLALGGEAAEGEEIITGTLACQGCGESFAIRRGIPRFVEDKDDYCGNFGFQWQHWKAIQVDRLSGHRLSETRFVADSGWDDGWCRGKLILDGGCGAGRFTDVAAGLGARVVAMDLSGAIDACRETTAIHDGRVACVQASLFAPPFKKGAFDGVFCMGVIQHTPDPERVITTLPAFLKPGGLLAYNFYEADWLPKLQIIKYALRLITPHLPTRVTLSLSKALVAALFPLTRWLSGIRKVRILNHVIPIASVHAPELSREQQYTWTVLDTFDWYGPRYEKRQNYRQVAGLVQELGLEVTAARAGIVTARRPE